MKFARKWMPKDLIDTESTLVQVMAWCHQAPSTYLNQYLQISWCHMVSPCRGRHYGRLLHSLNVLRFAHSNWYVEINNHNTSNYNKKEWYYKVRKMEMRHKHDYWWSLITWSCWHCRWPGAWGHAGSSWHIVIQSHFIWWLTLGHTPMSWVIIGSDNGFSSGSYQTITWTWILTYCHLEQTSGKFESKSEKLESFFEEGAFASVICDLTHFFPEQNGNHMRQKMKEESAFDFKNKVFERCYGKIKHGYLRAFCGMKTSALCNIPCEFWSFWW